VGVIEIEDRLCVRACVRSCGSSVDLCSTLTSGSRRILLRVAVNSVDMALVARGVGVLWSTFSAGRATTL
jgi:hypothetical protein